MLKSKRAQLNNIFIYVFALVVIGFIFIMGYNYITATQEDITRTDLILLKDKLTSDIKAISSDYGSSRRVSYSVPGSAELCLFDLDKKDEILSNPPADFDLLIKDILESNVKKNIFVTSPSIFESYYIGDIEINEPYFHCFKPLAGKVSFVIEGAGNKALISTNP
ncbi:MAG: hypothetical protein IIC69_02190 [Nanoarchaeota archaeon]|nr:hypothetical protein [Nanoarchaeota archaeon]